MKRILGCLFGVLFCCMMFGRLDVSAQTVEPRYYTSDCQVVYDEETKTLTVSKREGYTAYTPDAMVEWEQKLVFDAELINRWTLNESLVDSTGKEVPLEEVEIVDIQEGVEVIGFRACFDFSSLKKVLIPSTVSKINANAFYGANKITDFQVSEDNPYYKMSGGCLYQVQKKQLVLCPYKQKKKIQIKASTKEICELAFADCTELKEITIPKNVRLIHESFQGCTNLERVTFEEDSKCQAIMWGDSLGWDGESDPSPYYQGVFRGCDKLTSITFPDSLRYLGTQVFYQSNIQHVYLGESFMGFVNDYDTLDHDLSAFNQWVFSKEENQNYKTSTKLHTISEFAQRFITDVSLKSIRVSSKNKYFSSKNGVLYNKSMDTLLYYPRCKKGSSYTLPDSVTKLDKFCLTGNKYLKKIISKNKVKIRQPSAFLGSAKKQPTLDHEITVVQKKS